MADNYFTKMKKQTQTRLWINNPTLPEMNKAIATGAVCCTSNPTYCSNLLRRDRDFVIGVIREYIKEESNDSIVADLVQQKLVQRIMDGFRPIFDSSMGHEGFVSIQGDPHEDTDSWHIIEEVRRYRKLGPNFIAKIPVTEAGLKAIEILLEENIPIIATEVFALSQIVQACEAYARATSKTGLFPAYYVTHITGIYDEYLKDYVGKQQIDIKPAVLEQAGLILARKLYGIYRQRKYPGYMLGGGARTLNHFTGLVGGNMHITVNWSTVEEIIALDPPVEDTISLKASQAVIDELIAKVPDFRRAWFEEEMKTEEFKEYGPVLHFRNQFIKGWDQLLSAIADQRAIGGL